MSENRWFRDFSLLFLERAFPRTFACLSEPEKARLAREFSPASANRDLRQFSEFLESKKWPAPLGFLPDLARLEYALKLAPLAPELGAQGFERVAMASEPEWYAARFHFDPAHCLLDSLWPLPEIFETPKSGYAQDPGTFLIYRSGGKALLRRLKENEAVLIRALSLGVPLGRILERPLGPDFDAMTFHRWIESGFLRAIDWASV